MLELIIAIVLGILAGTITGIIPSLHINLIASLIISYSIIALGYFSPISIITFIISMSITHTFTDIIPSVFLGAPDSAQTLSVQPGHRFLLKGKAFEAVYLTVVGSLLAVITIALISPIIFITIKSIYSIISKYILILIIFASLFIMLKEKNSKFFAFIVFVLSGILGILSLNSRIKQPLLPLLSGLFGVSSLFIGLIKKTKIPRQRI